MFRRFAAAGTLISILIAGHTLGAEPLNVDLPIARPLAATFSSDGKQLAVGGLEASRENPPDGLVVLVDPLNGREQSVLRHSGTIKRGSSTTSSMNMIHALAYSPDSKMLAVAAELGLKLWDPADGEELATLAGYGVNDGPWREEVVSIAFSPDGKILAASGDGNRLRLWDVETRTISREFEVGYGDQLAFSYDGKLLVTAGHHNRAGLWRANGGHKLAEVHVHMGPLYSVAIDRHGKHVVVAGEGGVKLWQLKQNTPDDWSFTDEVRLAGQMAPVRQVAFSPDGARIITRGDDGAILIFDARSHELVGVLGHGGPFAISPDGNSLAVAEQVGDWQKTGTRLKVWSASQLLDPDHLAEEARAGATELVQSLASPRPDRQTSRMLSVLSGPGASAAAPILIEALQRRDLVRKQVLVMALGRFAESDAAARAALVKALENDSHVDTRSAAATALAKLPVASAKQAVPALTRAALVDESPTVKSLSLHALQRIDPAAYQQVAAEIEERGPMESKVEKRDGRLVYHGRPLEEWIERLSVSYIPNEIFGRPRPNEPLAAIQAIGPEAIPVLVETLRSNQRPLRRAAAAGLGALGPRAMSAVEPLLESIASADDKTLGIAGASADALALILKDRTELPARLLELSKSGNPSVRLCAARALAQTAPANPRGLPVLRAAAAALTSRDARPYMMVGPYPEQPGVGWLARVIADADAPPMDRVRAAESLARMGESAFPALPQMLQAATDENPALSYQARLAIQTIGPKAVPAVRDALAAAKDDDTRRRLAATLWGLGDEGRSALHELFEGQDSEELWWSAVSANWDPTAVMNYQMAIREALQQSGQPVPHWQPQFAVNLPGGPREMFQPPSVAWSAKLLVDAETPRGMRLQAASRLYDVRSDELLPHLPALLSAMTKEQDRATVSQLANVIQRGGPDAIPAVKGAIEATQSDFARRELLRALSSLGKEGREEFARLMQLDPEYRRLFTSRRQTNDAMASASRLARILTPREQQALAEAEKTNRPLTNGDFRDGLEGWEIEGGAGSFRTFPRGDGAALTTFGERQDADTGRLFQCFRVPEDAKHLGFKLHGGSNRDVTYVALWHKNKRHGRATARNDNAPFQFYFDLSALRGKIVTLEIVDHSAAGWGFIGVEDFRVVRGSD